MANQGTATFFTLSISKALLIVSFLALVATPLFAAPATLIDFESFPGPDGVLGTVDDEPAQIPPELGGGPLRIEDPFADLGIHITTSLFQGAWFPNRPATNHYISFTEFEITFDQPVHLVGIDSFSFWTVEMRAFDATGNEIDAATALHPNPSSAAFEATIVVSSETPIARVTIDPADGGPGGEILNLDDLVVDPSPCLPSDTVMCLGDDGRFQLELDWAVSADNTGPGRVADAGTRDSGLFWFFAPDNWEVLVKVLDGCGFNERFWVFFAATTNVGFDLTVTDLDAEQQRVYSNQQGSTAESTNDTDAFATCP